MRSIRLLALLVLSLSGAAGPSVAGECAKLVFSAHPDYPPYHWHENGQIVGASVEITARILDELKIPWEARYVGPWKRVLKSAEHGVIDMVASLKDTPERRAYLDFVAAPTFSNPMAVFVPADRTFRFESWQDLAGHRGGKGAGDRYGEGFDEFAEKSLLLEESDNIELNFQKLIAGRIDYVITGLNTGRAKLAALGLAQRVRPLDHHLNEGLIHHGFSRKSPCRTLIPAFERRLREMARDGTTAAILEQHLKSWAGREARREVPP